MKIRIAIAGIMTGLLLSFAGCASSGPKSGSNDELVKRIVAGIDIDKIARDAVAKATVAKATGDFHPTSHDNSVNWQIVATPLLYKDISGIRLVSPNRLLLSIDGTNPRLINTDNGSTVWEQMTLRYDERETGKSKEKVPPIAYQSYACVTVHGDLVLFRADGAKGSKLLAVETATGRKRWDVELKKSGELHLFPLPGAEVLLAVQQGKRQAVLTAFNLSTGDVVWKGETGYAGGTAEPPAPTVDDDAVFLFYDGVTRLSAASGNMVWRRPEILAGRQSPPMQLDTGRLHLLDGKSTLHLLDARTGSTLSSGKQRDGVAYTNIYLLEDRIYLRGVEKGKAGEPRFFVAAVRGADGKELWVDYDKDPSVSNLIDEDGRLFFSTPFTVVAVDRESGARRFAVRASDVGKSFPVRIAKYGNRVVYIGELVVAAFDAKTGAKVYRHGFDPVNQTAHMDALNESIESTEKYLSWFTGPLSDFDFKSLGLSDFFLQQTAASQERSAEYSQQAQKLRTKAYSNPLAAGADSDVLQSNVNRNMAKISAAKARAEFSMGMSFMTVENIQRGMAQVTAADRARLQNLLRIRKLLYAAYVVTQQGDYVCRPTKESGTVGISVIHLPSGQMSHTPLTKEHGELGVFNLVDFGKGIVYYAGIRKMPVVNAYFMARPVAIPK
jgi:outer membrane protein assembly factor BamB